MGLVKLAPMMKTVKVFCMQKARNVNGRWGMCRYAFFLTLLNLIKTTQRHMKKR